MMLSRLMPMAMPSSTSIPASSGPRWRMASHMCPSSSRLASRSQGWLTPADSTKPAMPHISSSRDLSSIGFQAAIEHDVTDTEFHSIDRVGSIDEQAERGFAPGAPPDGLSLDGE